MNWVAPKGPSLCENREPPRLVAVLAVAPSRFALARAQAQ
jgi:hypothetical protein